MVTPGRASTGRLTLGRDGGGTAGGVCATGGCAATDEGASSAGPERGGGSSARAVAGPMAEANQTIPGAHVRTDAIGLIRVAPPFHVPGVGPGLHPRTICHEIGRPQRRP